MSRKVILVDASSSYDGYGGEYDDEDLTITTEVLEHTPDIAKRFASEFAYSHMSMEELLKNEAFIKELDRRGFRDVSKVKNIEEKVKLGKRFFVHDGGIYPHLEEVDFENGGRRLGEKMAKKDSVLLQSIEKDSLKKINPEVYKSMKGAKKRIAASIKARKAKAKERAIKKKQKEVDKAREILEKAGEI